MSRTALIVGDPHATPQELEDMEELKTLVLFTVKSFAVDLTIILGDLYNTHSVVNTPTINFWNRFLPELGSSIILVGNHDSFSPTVQNPHALIIHKGSNSCHVVDEPGFVHMGLPGVAAMPYYYKPEDFLQAATELQEKTQAKTLICHQTFDGAKLQEGFYAKDGVNPVAVPFENIISGHIHTPMKFGKVWYPGAPRWRTLSDANQDRFIYVVEFKGDGSYNVLQAIPTTGVCKRINRFLDSEDVPAVIENNSNNCDVRVDIYGTQEYISQRMLELKATYNARCRSFPTRTKKTQISEADGIGASFSKFSNNFTPPNGTDRNTLLGTVNERIHG
jgi:DNA repair exonuclease SbcCD nuclease subunit